MKKAISMVIILVMIFSGCVQKKALNSQDRNYIVYNLEKLPKDLFQLDNIDIPQEDLALAIFEGLVSTDSDGKIVPGLADSYSISEDKLTYTFHLRDNIKWSDGSEITDRDFLDLFSQLIKENESIGRQLQCIFGVSDYLKNKIKFDGVAIRSKDNKSIEIRLNYPCGYFLNILAQPSLSMRKDFTSLKNWKNEYKNIKYSGAFIIDSMNSDGEISLKKNINYWDQKKVITDKIHIINEESSAFALAKYNSYEADIITNIPNKELKELQEKERFIKASTLKGYSLNFNLKKDKLINDINFRKVIAMSINKDELEKRLNGILKKSSWYIPINPKGTETRGNYSNAVKPGDTLEKLLSSSGYSREELKLIYVSNDINNIIVDSIVVDLKKAKINIFAEGVNEEKYKEMLIGNDYDFALGEYFGEYNNSLSLLEDWLQNSSLNVNGYKNSEFENSILKGKISTSTKESEDYLIKAEKILLNDTPFIPLGFYNRIICARPYINGIRVNKKGNIILKNLYFEKAI